MRICKIRAYDNLIMISPAHLNYACQLIIIVWSNVIYFMFAVSLYFTNNEWIKFGEFLFHLLDLQLLTVDLMTDVISDCKKSDPENTCDHFTSCILDDDGSLFFEIGPKQGNVLLSLIFQLFQAYSSNRRS